MKRCIYEEEAKGKTIKDFHTNYRGDLIITFTDDTFICFTVELGYDQGDYDIICDNVSIAHWREELVKAEIITQKELDSWTRNEKEAQLAWQEKQDRKTYERLKKQFE